MLSSTLLDDFGLAKLSAENRRDLLEITEDRYGVRSTVVTSQLPVENWHDIVGDPTLKASKQAPKSRRATRRAEVTLRYQRVALPCPAAAPVELWVVHAREERPPPKAEALEWFVLTTLSVTSTADA